MKPAIIHLDTHTGLYHPAPDSKIAWTVNDTRGYLDGGPTCYECGVCECDPPCEETEEYREGWECIGLSFAYVCLDGGEAYCQTCFDKLPDKPEIVNCDCR